MSVRYSFDVENPKKSTDAEPSSAILSKNTKIRLIGVGANPIILKNNLMFLLTSWKKQFKINLIVLL